MIAIHPIDDAGRYGITSPYSPALVARLKQIPGLAWSSARKQWVGYVDAMAVAAGAMGRMGLEVDVSALRNPLAGAFRGPLDARFPLRPYQAEGAAFLRLKGAEGALLGDAMGLGKTLTTIAAVAGMRVIVVCPSYVRGVWQAEFAKWDRERVAFFPQGVKKLGEIPAEATAVVIHYDILHAWADKLAGWNAAAVVFDEAHMLQSENSKRSVAARKVGRGCLMRVGLTGTPLTNRPRDIWNVVDVLSPGRLGHFFAFALRYCGAVQKQVTPEKVVWDFSGKSNLDELGARARYFMLRRTVADVGLQLPPKTRQIVWVDPPKRPPPITEARGDAAIRRALELSADGKLNDVWALLSGHLEEGARVVCFTWRRSVAEELVDRVRASGHVGEVVHGGISAQRRGLAIQRVKEARGPAALVATIDAASTGVDFTFATVCLFAEIDYKPHALLQAEARLHRFGATAPVLIQYALSRGTIDEVIAGIVVEKLDTFEAAIGTTGEALGSDLRGKDEDILAELVAAIENAKK